MFSEVFCTITGKVQMVGYRDFAQSAAKSLRLTGWVKNLENGTVQLLAQGEPDILKAFIEELNSGSVLAQVDTVATDWRTPEEQFEDFTLRF